MQHESIEFHGVYRYATREMVEEALAAARARLADDELADLDVDWLGGFTRSGASLRVRATLPGDADRYLAAELLRLLASHAIDGVVEVRRGGRALDLFPACCVLGPEVSPDERTLSPWRRP
jgi:hypothetical protein